MKEYNLTELKEHAKNVRMNALRAIHAASSGHPGGSFSCTELLTALYFCVMNIDPENPEMGDRDRFVLSKGHAAPALYAVLAERGYYDPEDIISLRKLGSPFQGHPNMHKVPGVEMSTGSLGQGFSVAVGMATADKIDGKKRKTYVLTGDGELQEGTIWESAMSAAHRGLENLVAFVDLNGLQIDGRVSDVKSVYSACKKFKAFGWNTECIDGHDFEKIFEAIDKYSEPGGKPTAIILKTHKGMGVSFMTDQAGWHGKAPNDEEFEKAMAELEAGLGEYPEAMGCHPVNAE